MSTAGINLLYLVTIVCFVLALSFLSSPATARRGNQIGAVGMVIAIVATLLKAGVHLNWEMVVAALVGGSFGAVGARRVKMTAMPQMVALFNGVGGGAAALVALAEFHEHRAAARPDPRRRLDRDHALGPDRVDFVRGLVDRVRQAAGADPRPPDHLHRARRSSTPRSS